jgi:hypothetical protein
VDDVGILTWWRLFIDALHLLSNSPPAPLLDLCYGAMDFNPWDQMTEEGENNLWYSRFLLYLQMGPARTLSGALRLADRAEGRAEHSEPYGAYKEAAKKYNWAERAEAYDAYVRKTAFSEGYAYDLTRIKKLSTLADTLEEKVAAMLRTMKPSRGGFSEKLVERYLQTVEAIAKETGGRRAGLDVSGSAITSMQRIVFFVPQVELGNDIDVTMPPPGGEGQADG